MRVRFVDPKTDRIVHPGPLEGTSDAVTSALGTIVPTVSSLTLHTVLAASRPLYWDVKSPLGTLEAQWPREARRQLGQSATSPPSTRLEIQSPHLPWRIVVRPRTPNIEITVLDLLAAVQKALELPITPGEWAQFGVARKDRIVAERSARVLEYDPGRRADGMYNHPTRIDSLGGFTQFGGLVPAPGRGPGCLDLKLERRR